ncbi:MAG: hypothetical protein QF495_12850 [SAR324 cluster bacterium]|nr:hypothetical protein [SAR324 cluster bacterium]
MKSESVVVQSSLKQWSWLLSAHGVTGFAQISSIYSQNYHPVTDAWESVPIASHMSFCTQGLHGIAESTVSISEGCPSPWGEGARQGG